jgi:hypothetical protein
LRRAQFVLQPGFPLNKYIRRRFFLQIFRSSRFSHGAAS